MGEYADYYVDRMIDASMKIGKPHRHHGNSIFNTMPDTNSGINIGNYPPDMSGKTWRDANGIVRDTESMDLLHLASVIGMLQKRDILHDLTAKLQAIYVRRIQKSALTDVDFTPQGAKINEVKWDP